MKERGAQRVYLAETPFHLFLTLTDFSRKKSDKVVLIDRKSRLIDYFEFPKKYFTDYDYINIKFATILISSMLIALKIKRLSIGKDIELITFNDSTFFSQLLFKALSGANIIYYDDGAASYNGHQIRHSKIKKILARFLLGRRFALPSKLGTSPSVNHLVMLFPENCTHEYKKLCCKQFQKINCINNVIEFYGAHPKFEELQRITKSSNLIVALPSATNSLSNLVRAYTASTGQIEKSLNIASKTHPLLENDLNFLRQGVPEIPRSLPVEVVPLFSNGDIALITEPNTCCFSFPFFFPKISIYCITSSRTEFLGTRLPLSPNLKMYTHEH